MRITSIIARYLLGLMFTVFGLNGFLQFIHQPPPADPTAMQFLIAVSTSHFAAFFFGMQVLGGLLLLSGYFVPLALTVLAAELQHPCVSPDDGTGKRSAGVGCLRLWILVFLQYRDSFRNFPGEARDTDINWQRKLLELRSQAPQDSPSARFDPSSIRADFRHPPVCGSLSLSAL